MPKEIGTAPATITLQFTLEEARHIVKFASAQAEATNNFFVVNALDALTRFVKQHERSA